LHLVAGRTCVRWECMNVHMMCCTCVRLDLAGVQDGADNVYGQ